MSVTILNQRIEELRGELHKLLSSGLSLQDPRVITSSSNLDYFISLYFSKDLVA